jgi:hypothetical protein
MDIPLSLNTIVVATSEQVSCALGKESAILNLKSSVYYGMDPVGTCVWDWLQHPRSIEELRNKILDEYEVDAERCEKDLFALLEKMHAEGLIQVSSMPAG